MPAAPPISIVLKTLLLGAFAGIVSGLFGVGGGVVVVPGLVLLVGLDQKPAAATSLATIVASAGAAVILFGRASAVDWDSAGYLLVGALVGAWIGVKALDRISSAALTWTFAALMLVAAGRLAVG